MAMTLLHVVAFHQHPRVAITMGAIAQVVALFFTFTIARVPVTPSAVHYIMFTSFLFAGVSLFLLLFWQQERLRLVAKQAVRRIAQCITM